MGYHHKTLNRYPNRWIKVWGAVPLGIGIEACIDPTGGVFGDFLNVFFAFTLIQEVDDVRLLRPNIIHRPFPEVGLS